MRRLHRVACGSDETLDLQHHLFLLTFGNKLYTAPIPKDQQLHRVLDVGTGTGIWAIDFGKYLPVIASYDPMFC